MPRRRKVLAAKAAVVGAITLVLGEALSFTAFVISEATLQPQSDLLSPAASLLVLIAWPAAGLVLAAVLINRDV